MNKLEEMLHSFEEWIESPDEHGMHPSDVAYLLKNVKKQDEEAFFELLNKIPKDELGEVLLELPEKYKDAAIEALSSQELAEAVEALESDDATDLVQDIEELDSEKSTDVVSQLDEEDREDIEKLSKYDEDQAGAFMQTEMFEAKLDERIQDSINRLRQLKSEGELENIHQVFLIDDNKHLIGTILLEDLITLDFDMSFQEALSDTEYDNKTVNATDDIEEVANIFEQYNLSVIPVIDWQGVLVGRITSDDIIDVIEDIATEQIYNMAGVDDEVENEDSFKDVAKNRASWLGLNLITAILASLVIGLFDETLQAFIPLAILMPIVASMGGNAGTQSLTVVVRQLALGDIEFSNAKDAIKKEVYISLANGFIFAFAIGVIAYLWFSNALLGVVIALAMIINLFMAGFFGASIPLLLKRLQIDPAVGSTVILTTVTDVVGFLSFLGLAKMILI